MNHIARFLQTLPLFHGINTEALETVSHTLIERKVKRGTVVCLRGERIDKVFIVYRGKIKIYRTDPEGSKMFISYCHSGDFFPHFGFFREACFHADAQAVEDSHLLVMPKEDMEQLLRTHPELTIRLIQTMGQQISDLEQQLNESIVHDAYERVIFLLLRLARTVGEPHQQGICLKERYTNRELAQMIGATRETVSRVMNRLKREGHVHLQEGHLVVHVHRLKELVDCPHTQIG
ncbi:Crp/Fnr family transcriptional regulator [Polycladomyces subterraneus]|uniref:Crp/Fnr family transcriptional regulator n=1 Tax=Polycladomyces subterraneus TaxID=1016997 RepID=A0ABT8IKV5_9BACL|nr:Crp/Fnr family transcriptional regulator [Polycladomyces subterraneus]MDN4593389.1 Crp/Fnr family transcriptional regulator [Polycladomyces subterraneus]